MATDFILDGQAHGSVAERLLQNDFDPGALRPYVEVDEQGNERGSFVTINNRGNPVVMTNANATLRKDEWKAMDTAVLKVHRERLNAVTDMRGAGLQHIIPNGLGKTVFEYEDQSDITDAEISMDGIRRGETSRPVYNLKGLPLPLIHKDFSWSARQIAASRNGSTPLDLSSAEMASRKVAEEAEKLLIGVSSNTGYQYAGNAIRGFIDFPERLTKALTAPTSSNHGVTLNEILDMRTQAYAANHYGPFMLYCSPAWDEYMDEDYSTAKGDNTLRERIKKIQNINDVKTLDFLTGTTLVLVQMSSDVVRIVIGLDVTTVQWETNGGMELNYKVMAIIVPQLRADHNGQTGIVHGSV